MQTATPPAPPPTARRRPLLLGGAFLTAALFGLAATGAEALAGQPTPLLGPKASVVNPDADLAHLPEAPKHAAETMFDDEQGSPPLFSFDFMSPGDEPEDEELLWEKVGHPDAPRSYFYRELVGPSYDFTCGRRRMEEEEGVGGVGDDEEERAPLAFDGDELMPALDKRPEAPIPPAPAPSREPVTRPAPPRPRPDVIGAERAATDEEEATGIFFEGLYLGAGQDTPFPEEGSAPSSVSAPVALAKGLEEENPEERERRLACIAKRQRFAMGDDTAADRELLVEAIEDDCYTDDFTTPTPGPYGLCESKQWSTPVSCGTYQTGCGKGCYTTATYTCTVCYCLAGQYSPTGMVLYGSTCSSCAAGTYAPSGASACYSCPIVSSAALPSWARVLCYANPANVATASCLPRRAPTALQE